MISTCVKIHQMKKINSAILEQRKLNITLVLSFKQKRINAKTFWLSCTWVLLILHLPLPPELNSSAERLVTDVLKQGKGKHNLILHWKTKIVIAHLESNVQQSGACCQDGRLGQPTFVADVNLNLHWLWFCVCVFYREILFLQILSEKANGPA